MGKRKGQTLEQSLVGKNPKAVVALTRRHNVKEAKMAAEAKAKEDAAWYTASHPFPVLPIVYNAGCAPSRTLAVEQCFPAAIQSPAAELYTAVALSWDCLFFSSL